MTEQHARKTVFSDGKILTVLPDGVTFFTCGHKGCTWTIASVGMHGGQKRLKINLNGMKRIEEPDLTRVSLEFMSGPDRLVGREDRRTARLITISLNHKKNTGGKCRCGKVHTITPDEIAIALGFKNCANALFAITDKKDGLWSQPKNAPGKFLATYVYRKDIDLQAVFAEPFEWNNDPFDDEEEEGLQSDER